MNIVLSSDRHFLSVQGEGPSMGRPAVFLRVAGCTLACKWCDTIDVWKNRNPIHVHELVEEFKEHACILSRPDARLILTGGSPLKQEQELHYFCRKLFEQDWLKPNFTIECETEATIKPDILIHWVDQWNVSPKLSNSGMPLKLRYNEIALEWHARNKKSIFKFPVTPGSKGDLSEVLELTINHQIPRERVWLMPVVSTRDEHSEACREVVRDALENGFNFSPRLQVAIWDKTTGV